MEKRLIPLTALALLLGSCGGDSGAPVQSQGWHFQGQNCLSCHNVDLKSNRHLLLAGTVFKSQEVSDPNDTSQVCGGKLFVQLLNEHYQVVYDSRNFYDESSAGYLGKGNIFILRRMLSDITPYGNYYVRVIDESGTLLAQSLTLHSFNGIDNFNPRENPTDPLNRFSCNACHRYPEPRGGAPGFIYPQVNKEQCK